MLAVAVVEGMPAYVVLKCVSHDRVQSSCPDDLSESEDDDISNDDGLACFQVGDGSYLATDVKSLDMQEEVLVMISS